MKKKIIALTTALCLSLTPTVMGAEIDLSNYTDDEIIELNQQINEEIVSRNIEKTAKLTAGSYSVGTEIPAGGYTLRIYSVGDSEYAKGDVYDENGNRVLWIWNEVDDNGYYEAHVTVYDGYTIECDGPAELIISAGIRFE